jgi:hypothetical protein
MTTFNIGTQNAATIQNVGGDMVVEGGLHASAAWESYQLRSEIDTAREEAARLPLPPDARSSVDWAFRAAAAQATSAKSDKGRVADLLARATRMLKDAGALTTAGASLVVALRRAAALLGPLGVAVLALL